MNILIEVGEVEYSKLSRQLRFKVACNMDAILATQASMEEIAKEMGEKLTRAILSDYYRGGMRIKK